MKANKFTKQHKKELGFNIPENYFEQSKSDILKAVGIEGSKEQYSYRMIPVWAYSVAASVLILVGLFIGYQNNIFNPSKEVAQLFESSVIELNISSDEVLISSLYMDDKELSAFMGDYLVEAIIDEEQQEAQERKNFIINSIFINDSLLDEYIYNELTQQIIL
jgi:hypothetical protein